MPHFNRKQEKICTKPPYQIENRFSIEKNMMFHVKHHVFDLAGEPPRFSKAGVEIPRT